MEKNNLLPYDGAAFYYKNVFLDKEAFALLEVLQNEIAWQNDEVVMFGKTLLLSRKVAWYGDAPFAYTYSQRTKIALNWTETLILIKNIVSTQTGYNFNTCLLNYYNDGDEGMSWHSDDEKTMKPNAPIASVSFGASRKFSFKHKKTKEKIDIVLENGSVLIMTDETQTFWWHALPKSKKVKKARINLTFRTFVP